MLGICLTRLTQLKGVHPSSDLLDLVIELVHSAERKETAVVPLDPIQPQPGHAVKCKSCVNWSEKGWDMGHPAPCKQCKWYKNSDGISKRKSPELSRDLDGTVICNHFTPNPKGHEVNEQ